LDESVRSTADEVGASWAVNCNGDGAKVVAVEVVEGEGPEAVVGYIRDGDF